MDSTPRLVVPAEVFPNGLAARGVLTPTPWLMPDGTIRVFAGLRGSDGYSRLGYVDLAGETAQIIRICESPIADLGAPGSFDAHGMILGDVFADNVSQSLCIAYVGFSSFPSAKFRAYTGLLMSTDGQNFERCTNSPWVEPSSEFFGATILAIHSVQRIGSEWLALAAVGSDWEWIDGQPFPRYNIHEATGPDLLKLRVDPNPLVDMPSDLYRLGRPRYETWAGSQRIVATGGRRDGDYRAYVLQPGINKWAVQHGRIYPVDIRPGCSEYAQVQAAYPAIIRHPSGTTWAFFCGDAMGRAGILATSWPTSLEPTTLLGG